MSDNNFSRKIIEHIAVLSRNKSTGWTKELNKVSFNGAKSKIDIREWDPTHIHFRLSSSYPYKREFFRNSDQYQKTAAAA